MLESISEPNNFRSDGPDRPVLSPMVTFGTQSWDIYVDIVIMLSVTSAFAPTFCQRSRSRLLISPTRRMAQQDVAIGFHLSENLWLELD